ncbi:MAG: flagellar hook-basal body complex protein [Phycisphaeraceae bacterium]|nr:flagellar hook-basal body complex protein [Phycisphaeraceae bacterium]MBX3406333.1 flagellar hook-basal body complex protein [Phycisphaeraceae bacterium]
MASTVALFTGLSGLVANARNLDVIGNNIANVNTTAFKSSRMLFSTQFSRTFSMGAGPTANFGGSNPGQIGLGVTIAGTQRDFSGGSISATGDQRDLGIEGDGFFVVRRADATFYTRAGAFRQNEQNDLVTVSGERVQGYGVDSNFNIVQGALTDINIPVGTLTLAQATRNVRLAGNLNTNGAEASQGARYALAPLALLAGATPPSPGNAIETTSRLVEIEDAANPGNSLFAAGQSIQLRDAHRGSRSIPTSDLPITGTTTVQDLLTFLSQALGINAATGANPDSFTPGVSLDPVTGVVRIVGNTGTVNDLQIDASDLRVLNSAGAQVSTPFGPTREATADGESVRTSLVVFDSLGTPVTVELAMVLESKTNAGTTWRYYADSNDDTDLSSALATGTAQFDTAGRLDSPASFAVSIDRQNTGAQTPLVIDVALSSSSDNVTALADVASQIAATYQDGTPRGTLASFGVGADGVIVGAFTNGLTRPLGQVALATFSNNDGLVEVGSNMFTTGPNSGTPQITSPQTLGAGRIIGGALELSNVDLSQEFINLILASTGYSAASRVITTTDQLMQQLLVLGR